ncbi:interleukin-1 receptor-associated kinase 4 [Vigna unguiculata]|uniref:Interleukin-1 receptor-associated kinase 4 n=1 Tax=Vigna unguiculata TaxID=3917 RepID=A0A4D6NI97_VIGUN|nr:interleukin-1 receptor-associated kinase 4 [Vigna unguiculata]
MLRRWDVDKDYVTSPSVESLHIDTKTKLNFTEKTPNYTAPNEVYRSLRNMGSDGSANMRFNLTWQLPVDLGFTYLLRLHFCQLDPEINSPGDLIFYIYIQDRCVEEWADVLRWSGEQKGVPVVKDYTVFVPLNQDKANLSLKMHPNPQSKTWDAQINAIELFKFNDSSANLAGPNPSPSPKISGGSNKKDGTSRGGGSSSLPTNLCRHFSIAEIRAATNSFDEQMGVGVGGFGKVYRGYIDDGSTCVAVKRLKRGSLQGINEFVNEIEMLSQLRHLNLVSLISYCYESNEMILVYDFMGRGTLRDHLYDSDNPSLPWEQRVEICIGTTQWLNKEDMYKRQAPHSG